MERGNRAFTLIELLIVIGIIVVLIAILLPVVSSVRKAANITATKNQMSTIASACQAYYGDYHSYPGPFSENQIDTNTAATWTLGTTGDPLTGPSGNMTNITSTENLVLGLSGGLSVTFNTSTGAAMTFVYNPANVNSGPQVLNTLISAQKQTTAYYTPTPAELAPADPTTTYQAFNTATTATDSVIPEYYDHIPGGIVGSGGGVVPNQNLQSGPILYLRARVAAAGPVAGVPGVINDPTTPSPPQAPASTYSNYIAVGTPAIGYQYNFNQLMPYGFTAVPNVLAMGANNTLNAPDDTNDFPLPNPNPPTGTPYASNYTYDAMTVYFANSGLVWQPKGKDAFLLISAGTDRIFGTKDDIIYGN